MGPTRKAGSRSRSNQRSAGKLGGRRTELLLRSYVAPEVVAHILSRGRTPLVSGVRRPASVLFADLRGFTHLAARLNPDLVVKLLDDFFGVMTDVAVGHRAMIDKLMGDAIMLLYGVPRPRKDDAARAVRTALEMQGAFLALRNRWLSSGRDEVGGIGLGVGVATGEVVIGNIGSAVRMDYTAVGEAVNCAARLCAAAQHGDTLVDQATFVQASAGLGSDVVFTSAEVTLKNLDSVAVYRCQPHRAGLRVVSPRSEVDPVCGMKVNPRHALRRAFGGQAYYFCSRACAWKFVGDPQAFAK